MKVANRVEYEKIYEEGGYSYHRISDRRSAVRRESLFRIRALTGSYKVVDTWSNVGWTLLITITATEDEAIRVAYKVRTGLEL